MCNYCNKWLDVSQYSIHQWKKVLYDTNRKCLECSFPYYINLYGGEKNAREFIEANLSLVYFTNIAQIRRQKRAMELAALAEMATKFDGQSHAFGLPIINTTTAEGLSYLKSLVLAKIRRGGWFYTGDSRMGLYGEILYNEGNGFILRPSTMFCKPVRGGFVRLLTSDVGSTPNHLLQTIVHPICAGELICVWYIVYFIPLSLVF